MLLRDLFETYSERNTYLRNYLKGGEFDPYHYWWAICQWAEDTNRLKYFTKITGTEYDSASDLQEEEPDIFYKLPKALQDKAAEWAVDYIMRNDPAEADSTQYFDLRSKKMLPRQTWLIHFTNDADEISKEGFKRGVDDIARLGLTTYYKNDGESKKYGGYNFAFLADSRYAANAAFERKYGDNAVMFQNSGVHAWHNSDEEEQVIFWGPDVKPRDIVMLKREYDEWSIMKADGWTAVYKGSFNDCVQWVMHNFQQYRKALTGF